ncbi:hypothetical protein [Kitasatospora sp. NPDC091207]|uniref:effector-associated constant component EACC1 n=1 Tax=Kitasatospora sp. NPDC091207 TaxID=3364083 RepID=UPI00381F9458
MDLHLSVTGGQPAPDAESLTDWLRGEPELAGTVHLTGAAPRPGELGTALDVLTVAVGAGGGLSVLAASLRTWFAHPRRSDVRLKIRRPDGESVELDAKRVSAAELEAVLRQVLDRGPVPDSAAPEQE